MKLDGDREVAYDDVARVWLHATVERAVDREDGGLLLVVCLEPFDDHDGAPVGALSKRFAVVWPSNHVVCAGPPLPDAPARHRALVGRTLEHWGAPSVAGSASPARPRWRVVRTYASIDEKLCDSGSCAVALLEPAKRELRRGLFGGGGDDAACPRAYARCGVAQLLASATGWRPCAACVVAGCRDPARCRDVLAHAAPDCDAAPRVPGGALRVRVDTPDGGRDWRYATARAARFGGGPWRTAPSGDAGPLEIAAVFDDGGREVVVPWPSDGCVSAAPGAAPRDRLGASLERCVGRWWRRVADLAEAGAGSRASHHKSRFVVDVFESTLEGRDGVFVRHCAASRRSDPLDALLRSSHVTRSDVFLDKMRPADAIGSSFPWQPLALAPAAGPDAAAARARHLVASGGVERGDFVEAGDRGVFHVVLRGGETLSYVAAWAGTSPAKLAAANAGALGDQTPAEDSPDDEPSLKNRSRAGTAEASGLLPSSTKRRRDRRPRRAASPPRAGRAFRAGDVLQVPASPVKCARCLPPADAVEGDLALPAGEFVPCGGGAWYATAEGESCETVSRKFYGAAGDEGVGVYAANRHREALWNLSPRGALARWTVLFVPRAADFRPAVLATRRSKACAACVCSGDRSARHCRDVARHGAAPDCDDLDAARPFGAYAADTGAARSYLGARVRVRWVDEATKTAQWLYATVTAQGAPTPRGKLPLTCRYDDESDGCDEVLWPCDDAVALPRDAPPRPRVTARDAALVGKSFEWKRSKAQADGAPPGRWVVTDVFDSLDEGVDAVVATIRRAYGDADAASPDDEELYESLEELRGDAADWRDAPTSTDLRRDELPDDLRPGRERLAEAKLGGFAAFLDRAFYVARDNDTLAKIAQKLKLRDVDALLDVNAAHYPGLTKTSRLRARTAVELPPDFEAPADRGGDASPEPRGATPPPADDMDVSESPPASDGASSPAPASPAAAPESPES